MPNSALKVLSVCALIFTSSLSSAHAQSAPDTLLVSKINAGPPVLIQTTSVLAEHWLNGALYDYAWGDDSEKQAAEKRLEGYLVQHFARLLRDDGVETLEADYVAAAATRKVILVMDVITEPLQFLVKADLFAFQELALQRQNR